MKRTLTILLIFLNCLWINAQGFGFGYNLDIGGSPTTHPTDEYSQYIFSRSQNMYLRFHNQSGRKALQFQFGMKTDEAYFTNYADYLAQDGTLTNYNSNGIVEREAWKFAMIRQYQFGKRPGKFMFSINPGLFYEHTLSATRYSDGDGLQYELINELNPENFGYTLGFEFRIKWITLGYKTERLFGDVINRDYLLSQELNNYNSSELRGLVLNPKMNYFYVGINIDYFNEE